MKNYTDVPYVRLAIMYLVQDIMNDKREMLWVGMVVFTGILTLINIGIIILYILL